MKAPAPPISGDASNANAARSTEMRLSANSWRVALHSSPIFLVTCIEGTPSGRSDRRGRASDPLVDILHAYNVVLAQIGARLDLDQIERDLSRIFEAVHAAQRHEDRFVFAQQDFLVIARDNRGPVDDHPVLGPVKMLLQRKLRTRLDGDAF